MEMRPVQVDIVLDSEDDMKFRNGFVSNSSSSSFICNVDLTIDEATVKLHKLHEMYCELNDIDVPFYDIFDDPIYMNDEKKLEYYRFYSDGQAIGQGNIIINSAGDNTIPWELFDLIESTFNAKRVHMG